MPIVLWNLQRFILVTSSELKLQLTLTGISPFLSFLLRSVVTSLFNSFISFSEVIGYGLGHRYSTGGEKV
jgi:hypothetical protein